MNIHFAGGWAFTKETCEPLLRVLAERHRVFFHAFDDKLDSINVSPTDGWLAGWSLGGLKMLDEVIRGKLKPRGLILINSTSRFCSDADYPCGVSPAALRTMMIGIKRQRVNTLSRFYADAMSPQSTEADVTNRLSASNDIDESRLLDGLQQLSVLDLRASIAAVAVPVLLLHGEKDHIIPADASRYLQSQLVTSEIHTHPDAGHELPLQFPQWTSDHIDRFISKK